MSTSSTDLADVPGALDAAAGLTAERYAAPAVLLHWVMAALVLAALPLGLYMVDLSISPTKLKYYSWHKWLGVTVLLLAAVRVAWRLKQQPPEPLPRQPRWQAIAAHTTHAVLYALLIAVPLSGWLYSSAAGFPTVYLGLVQLPDLVHKDDALKAIFKTAHWVLTYAMGALVLLHVAASVKHAVVDRDGTLSRMSLRLRQSPGR